jgi:hypothetical protein
MLRFIAFVTAIFVIATYAIHGAAEPRVFRIDDWCLEHSGDDLTFFPDPGRPSGAPELVAKSDFPLPLRSPKEGETGLVVGYSKSPTFARRAEIVRGGRGRAGCERHPLHNGLSQLKGTGLENCSVREQFDWQSNWFEPTEKDNALEGVFVICGRRTETPNCHLYGLLDNGWQAEVLLPKTHMGRWNEAAQTAQNYYDQFLSDCG